MVVVVRLVVFFDVDFAGVLLPDFRAVGLLTVRAGVLLALREDLLVLRAAVLVAGDAARLPADDAGDAIASICVCGFFAGLVARTSRTASVCCSRVIRNS